MARKIATPAAAAVLSAAALVAAPTAVTAPAQAETVLKFNKFIPSRHPYQVHIMDVWAKDVERVTGGSVKVEFTGSSLAPPPRQFDLVRSGGADMAFSFVGYNPDRFVRTNMLALPMLGPSAKASTTAYWSMYDKTFAPQNEFRGVKLISLWTNMPGYLFTKNKVRKVADYAGVKTRVGDRILAATVKQLGGVPVFSPAPRSYEMLSRGVLTAAAFPALDVMAFKVQQFIPNAAMIPGGVFSGAFYIIINERTWMGLSEKDRKAIDGVSYAALAVRAAGVIDGFETKAQAALAKQGVDMWKPDAAFMSDAKKAFDVVEKAWIKAATSKDFDAAKALAEFRKIAAETK